MEKFKIALEQLKHIPTLNPSPFPISSPNSQTTDPSKRQKPNIPDDLDLNNVYNPKYTVVQLISTRRRTRKQAKPPRPPNSFFLFKNCYILELRKLGYRYRMPDVCYQTKQIWSNVSPNVKEKYEILALQAQILHQELYPEYKFSPTKKNKKGRVSPSEKTIVDSSMLSTFSVTNFLGCRANNSPIENISNSESTSFESSQLLSPSITARPSTSSSSFLPSATLSPYETINPVATPELTTNLVDYNNYNFLYMNNYYLNPLNNVLIQNPPAPSSRVNTAVYPQIMNSSSSNNPSAFNQLG